MECRFEAFGSVGVGSTCSTIFCGHRDFALALLTPPASRCTSPYVFGTPPHAHVYRHRSIPSHYVAKPRVQLWVVELGLSSLLILHKRKAIESTVSSNRSKLIVYCSFRTKAKLIDSSVNSRTESTVNSDRSSTIEPTAQWHYS